jgi:hypothetical protein
MEPAKPRPEVPVVRAPDIVVPEGSTKPVLIFPGMWSEELWQQRAREHQSMLLRRSQSGRPSQPSPQPVRSLRGVGNSDDDDDP